ncbi:hypothetical protein GIW70_01180 [Pseudomonas syringae]|nr:hypothetical protein [Pseudomonas syringae]MCF5066810.1 hypothetical protein [Pseudomonas syringae]
MPGLKNFVAVDWRSGPDRIYFFFKDTDTYSRYDIGEEKLLKGYPATVKNHWHTFEPHARNLRFGFTTTSLGQGLASDEDIAWLFFYNAGVPTVCKYDQDADKVVAFYNVENSIWAPLLPYFDKIVCGTWWQRLGYKFLFKFLTRDGQWLTYNYIKRKVTVAPVTGGLERYKDRIITAAQNDRTFADSHWYFFLTENQYLTFNLQTSKLLGGPANIDGKWPELSQG